jgi:electron transport complex protein RnfG
MSDEAPDTGPGLTHPGRLIATLGGFGALSGLLLVIVFVLTQPAIQAYKAAVLKAAINEVLGEPDRYDTLYVVDDAIVDAAPDGADPEQLEAVYLGYRDGRPVGFAVRAAGPGFQDTISMIVGYDPSTSQVLGMKVLESKETPGLGDKIFKDLAFVAEFAGVDVPLVGVKTGSETGQGGEVVMITGATISSRAIIKAINTALERMDPLLAAYRAEQTP